MYAITHHAGRTLSYRVPSARNELLRNQVKVTGTPTRSCTYTFTKEFTGLYTGLSRKVSPTGKLPCRPAEVHRPKVTSAGLDQSMRCQDPASEKRTVQSNVPTETSTHGAAIAVTGPSGPQGTAPSAPEVLVVDASPTFHEPSSLDDVNGQRIPLTEALKRGMDPCPYCYPGWSR